MLLIAAVIAIGIIAVSSVVSSVYYTTRVKKYRADVDSQVKGVDSRLTDEVKKMNPDGRDITPKGVKVANDVTAQNVTANKAMKADTMVSKGLTTGSIKADNIAVGNDVKIGKDGALTAKTVTAGSGGFVGTLKGQIEPTAAGKDIMIGSSAKGGKVIVGPPGKTAVFNNGDLGMQNGTLTAKNVQASTSSASDWVKARQIGYRDVDKGANRVMNIGYNDNEKMGKVNIGPPGNHVEIMNGSVDATRGKGIVRAATVSGGDVMAAGGVGLGKDKRVWAEDWGVNVSSQDKKRLARLRAGSVWAEDGYYIRDNRVWGGDASGVKVTNSKGAFVPLQASMITADGGVKTNAGVSLGNDKRVVSSADSVRIVNNANAFAPLKSSELTANKATLSQGVYMGNDRRVWGDASGVRATNYAGTANAPVKASEFIADTGIKLGKSRYVWAEDNGDVNITTNDKLYAPLKSSKLTSTGGTVSFDRAGSRNIKGDSWGIRAVDGANRPLNVQAAEMHANAAHIANEVVVGAGGVKLGNDKRVGADATGVRVTNNANTATAAVRASEFVADMGIKLGNDKRVWGDAGGVRVTNYSGAFAPVRASAVSAEELSANKATLSQGVFLGNDKRVWGDASGVRVTNYTGAFAPMRASAVIAEELSANKAILGQGVFLGSDKRVWGDASGVKVTNHAGGAFAPVQASLVTADELKTTKTTSTQGVIMGGDRRLLADQWGIHAANVAGTVHAPFAANLLHSDTTVNAAQGIIMNNDTRIMADNKNTKFVHLTNAAGNAHASMHAQNVSTTDDVTVGRTLNIRGGASEHNPNKWGTQFAYTGDNKNYIRGDTEIMGNTTNVGDLNVGRNMNLRGGASEHNPNKWGTHLPWPGDNKNYIRGDTEIRGNTTNVGDLNVGRNMSINGSTELKGNTTNNGDLIVGRNASIRGDTEVRGNLNNVGDMNVGRNLNVGQTMSAGSVTANNRICIGTTCVTQEQLRKLI